MGKHFVGNFRCSCGILCASITLSLCPERELSNPNNKENIFTIFWQVILSLRNIGQLPRQPYKILQSPLLLCRYIASHLCTQEWKVWIVIVRWAAARRTPDLHLHVALAPTKVATQRIRPVLNIHKHPQTVWLTLAVAAIQWQGCMIHYLQNPRAQRIYREI